ncbi:hypothetical protein [Streptomyces sp900116325]|uniref:hypothetical protein n=1 Tax=Streptomyces sp. 900116325 TaxID=3154295 RepID=UPI00332EBE95
MPHLASCYPPTGQPIRAERRSHALYEPDRPRELSHLHALGQPQDAWEFIATLQGKLRASLDRREQPLAEGGDRQEAR